ncbi:MAG TPA: L-threonylcarbamoyladenylate synthase [Candidatus Saccharibacteria bacterium]|nr:L-threonylcarbamoyladenylate synthase [Candidatus Saccharibacteria bacterium]
MNDVQLLKTIEQGSVVVLPTDTVYGLACSVFNPQAVNAMYNLKNRDGKPGTVIAADTKQLLALGFPADEIACAEMYWPAPVSVILSAPDSLVHLHMGLRSLAVRIPVDEQLRMLLKETGPLATTSANFAGEPTVTSVQQAKELFGEKIALYVDGGDLSGRTPSQIIRITKDGSVKRIR